MANKLEIQYVHYYTDGSAARELQPQLPRKKRTARLPKPKKQTQLVVRVDPLAVIGIVVATVMLVLMLVGVAQLSAAQDQADRMADYVQRLTVKNAELQNTYRIGYDLESVMQDALGMGMIPAEQARQIPITLPAPEVVEELTVWEQIQAFFAQLFA